MKAFLVICVHEWETNTHTGVNLYEMSTHKSCWGWSVETIGYQRHSFWNSQTDIQMYTFLNKWIDNLSRFDKFEFQIPVKTSCIWQRWRKRKEFLHGIVSWLLFFCFTSSVPSTQKKWRNSHHSHHVLSTHWLHGIYREYKVKNIGKI